MIAIAFAVHGRGSALLIGVGGLGKHLRDSPRTSPVRSRSRSITKTYNQANLFEDLKGLYKIAGLKGEGGVHLHRRGGEGGSAGVHQSAADDGRSSGCFPRMSRTLVNDCRPGRLNTRPRGWWTDNLWSFFLSRVRDNLHLCLCFSPWRVAGPSAATSGSSGAPSTGSSVAAGGAHRGLHQVHRGRRWRRRRQGQAPTAHGRCARRRPKACREYFASSATACHAQELPSFIAGYKDLYAKTRRQGAGGQDQLWPEQALRRKQDVKTMQVELGEERRAGGAEGVRRAAERNLRQHRRRREGEEQGERHRRP